MMQKITLLFVLCFTMLKAPAQETALNCNDNLKQALTYLKGNDTIQKDSLKAIATLKPCLRAKNANAQLITGHLYLNASDKKSIRKGFQLIRKAAKQKHPVAMENLEFKRVAFKQNCFRTIQYKRQGRNDFRKRANYPKAD
jgi:TPR repeat protein